MPDSEIGGGGSPGSALPNYWERDATARTREFAGAAIAPHALTTRFTYTVPVGKLAFIETVRAQLIRTTVAGAPGLAQAAVTVDPSGGELETALAKAFVLTNAVGDADRDAPTQLGYLDAGDVIAGITIDPSTGGEFRFDLNAKVVEFDALA